MSYSVDRPSQGDLGLPSPAYPALLSKYQGLDPALVRLPPDEVSLLTGLAKKTLESMRVSGTGPAFMKLGRKVQYRLVDLLAYMKENTFTNTRQAKTARAGGGL